jgi:hypothetical protein
MLLQVYPGNGDRAGKNLGKNQKTAIFSNPLSIIPKHTWVSLFFRIETN